MFFLLNQELVEICSFVKTFETEPSLQAFILVNLKNVKPSKNQPSQSTPLQYTGIISFTSSRKSPNVLEVSRQKPIN